MRIVVAGLLPSLLAPIFCSGLMPNILTHLPSLGSFFTWSNGRLGADFVSLRLDRAICNNVWLNFRRRMNCQTLIRHHSDHHPLLLSVDSSDVKISFPFKFFKTWTSH